MPGYHLVEQQSFSKGLKPYEKQIGILDFLRELAGDAIAFPKFYEVRIVGLEDILYAAQPRERELALEIRKRLRQAASELEKRLVNLQVVFAGKLMRGDSFWVEYRKQRLPIDLIFGTPTKQEDPAGSVYFHATFNLTNGG
ncbi:MAG: hypothetical protein HY694_10035 [Deltaproteobacteria bacterium]|nr:hypothetical protein [Deltaproteobacteria bacterium]